MTLTLLRSKMFDVGDLPTLTKWPMNLLFFNMLS